MYDLKQTGQKVSAYNGNPLRSIGCFGLYVLTNESNIYVVETTSPHLLGMRPSLDYGLIKPVYSCKLDTTQDNSEPLIASHVKILGGL